MNRNKKGFTIVELVIVIAILAILAAVLIPDVCKPDQEGKRSKRADRGKEPDYRDACERTRRW